MITATTKTEPSKPLTVDRYRLEDYSNAKAFVIIDNNNQESVATLNYHNEPKPLMQRIGNAILSDLLLSKCKAV